MKLFHYLCIALLVFAGMSVVYAQPTPVSATLQHNNAKAVVQSNGALFTDFSQGQFIVPYQAGQPEISALRASGLWLGGLDDGGNLKVTAQMYNEDGKSDFAAGLYHPEAPDSPPFNKIWRVTREQIYAHFADYNDNGIIDNPIPEIFAWPGYQNPNFEAYNPGQTLPDQNLYLAPYWDHAPNGSYNPEAGDYPLLGIRGCIEMLIPSEMLWFTFHDRTPHTQTMGYSLYMEIQATIFSFGCEEPDNPLNNTIFTYYKFINRGIEPLDSVYFGVFTDFDIGNPDDDFIGCDTSRQLIFAYNGDAIDEGYYEANAPVAAVDMLRGPMDNTTTWLEAPFAHVVPFSYDEGGDGAPQNASEYYRLLTGHRRDGLPLLSWWSNYPGDPNDPNADSELTAGNTPGNRRVVSSYGPFNIAPGAVNELIVSYSFTQIPAATPLENVAAMYAHADILQTYFDDCFEFIGQSCTPITSVENKTVDSSFGMTLMPNPTSNEVRVQFSGSEAQRLEVYDATGRKVAEMFRETGASEWLLPVRQLPAGMYWIKAQGRDGLFAAKPLVVSR